MIKQGFCYQQYYCEENIWHLIQEPIFANLKRKVVFISNEKRDCPLWGQEASISTEDPVWWDYHVIMLCYQNSWTAWDLDTLVGFPVDAEEYFLKTFRGPSLLTSRYNPFFRVIDAAEFIKTFSSDRSHMRSSSGTWLSSPPPWPPILRGDAVTFEKFVDMNSDWVGEVLTLTELRKTFGH